MAFIDKNDPTVLNIKLTSKGRELLSQGLLDFSYFVIGDSEIDYRFNANVMANNTGYTAFNANILKPVDKNPNIISSIPKNLSGDPYNVMTTVPSTAYIVQNAIGSLGFFTSGGTTFITDANHVKQPDAMVQVNQMNGGVSLTLTKAPTYGANVNEPSVGDLLFIRWTHVTSTTGHAVNKAFSTPNLWYKITSINGSGKLFGSGVNVSVDRKLPDFSSLSIASSVHAGAMIYYNHINYSGDTVLTMTPTEYLDESVISFLQNSECPTVVFPFWNMSIVFTEEIAGVKSANLKYTQFKNVGFGGFISYIQNQVPTYKKLGIIHYTNNSPANVYAEGFLVDVPSNNVPKLEIPTIMWHKSTSNEMGVTLKAIGSSKMLVGATKSLNLAYYDLADTSGNIIGKVFPDLKIFVIEDQELLFAMSYKSNRSWTLPNFAIGS